MFEESIEKYFSYASVMAESGVCPHCNKRLKITKGIRITKYECDCKPWGFNMTIATDLSEEESERLKNNPWFWDEP